MGICVDAGKLFILNFSGLASLQGTGADSNGLYLIRDSTSSDKDFVVSVTHDAKVFHFQIKEVFDGHYKLDEGPTTQGKWSSLLICFGHGYTGFILYFSFFLCMHLLSAMFPRLSKA